MIAQTGYERTMAYSKESPISLAIKSVVSIELHIDIPRDNKSK
jgi:hypothetical protein